MIIAIGSSNVSGTEGNPYTAEVRARFIQAALSSFSEYEGRYTIVEVPDINDNPKWPAHVEATVAGEQRRDSAKTANFGSVYTGSPLTKALFTQYSSHPVEDLKKNIEVSATDVRNKIMNGDDWQWMVPKSVAELITSL